MTPYYARPGRTIQLDAYALKMLQCALDRECAISSGGSSFPQAMRRPADLFSKIARVIGIRR